jgi:glycosyltransferase involved in cell wall biosynthesis
MPVYNGEECLQKSISSVLSQTLQDFKILAYDDGSTDGTVQKLESFNDPRIRIVKGEENRGVLYVRSKMIPMIDTEYCMWLDDDDYFCRNDALERALTVAKSKDFDLVTFAKIKWVFLDGSEIVSNPSKKDFEYFGDKFLEKCYPYDQHQCLTTKIIRSEILKKCIPEENITSNVFTCDDIFFMYMMPIFVQRYCHLASDEPIYTYNCEIGVWGSKRKDYSLKRFDDWCYCVFQTILSVYNRMKAIRKLTKNEAVNLLHGCNFPNMLEHVKKANEIHGRFIASKMVKIFFQYFGEDGIHVLNGVKDLMIPEFVSYFDEFKKYND